MSGIAGLNLKQAREKAAKVRTDMGAAWDEAKGSDGEIHFAQVKCFGGEVKGSIAVAEKFNQLNDELNELHEHIETLATAERAGLEMKAREKVRSGFIMPGQEGWPANREQFEQKSLGELITGSDQFKAWGGSGDIAMSFKEALFSDMAALAMRPQTLQYKTLMATSAGYAPQAIRLPGFVDMPTRPIQLLDILTMFQTGENAIKYMEETTRTHGAAETAEGGTYAESAFAFTERTSGVVKITDSLPITDEQLADVPMMNGYVNARLMFGVRRRMDSQALIGDGSSPNLRGLKNVSGINAQARGVDPQTDAFYKAMTLIRTVGFDEPTHHVIHPTDWQGIRLSRTADGIYIWGAPSDSGTDRLWGLPVIQDAADSAGTGYTGCFNPDCVAMFEKAGIDVQVGYINTQFTEGKRTIRADTRVALVWFKPASFTKVTGL